MEPVSDEDLIAKLKNIQCIEKMKAGLGGSWPKDKIIEECCEVLIDYLEKKETEGEELDLLMCLIDKYMGRYSILMRWKEKLLARGRTPTNNQERFFKALE